VQPQRTEPTTETQTAALPPAQPAAPPPSAAASAAAGQRASYVSQLQGYLNNRFRNMNSTVREQIIIKVTVTIETDGSLSSIDLTQSSGSSNVDSELLRRIRAASPVPAPPERMANYTFPFLLRPSSN
jgi:TonB family protein